MGCAFLVAYAFMAKFRFVAATSVVAFAATGLISLVGYTAARKIQSPKVAIPIDSSIKSESLITEELPKAPAATRSATLVFVGDVMLDRHVLERIEQAKDDTYPFQKIMRDSRFTAADARIANLEGPLTSIRRPPIKSIDFAFDPRFAEVLKQIGFDAVSQANNHTLDQGRAGQEDSSDTLRSAGIETFGDETREDDSSLTTLLIHNRRIVIIGFNSVSDKVDLNNAALVMQKAREAADTVIVFMHWGEEYHDKPTKAQKEFGRWLIDNGAAIVIGGHPHWMQGIDVYKDRPIVYSLGNFIFDQYWSEETQQGLAVKVLLSDDEMRIELNPVHIDKSRPRFLDGKERDDRLLRLSSISDPSLTTQILQGQIIIPTSSF